MALEAGTYVSDLVAANPPGTDKKKQGDDHIRLIKSVLQTTLPNASKAFRFPTAVAKSAGYSPLLADDNTLFYTDTSGGDVTYTLPTLAAGDKGWMIRIVKVTTDANTIFIVPPAGTINGFTKIRRSVEHIPFWVMWTGTVFVASRQFGVPIGSRIPFHGTSLPNGTLWPDGATFTAANFVELNTALGGNTKPDTRGRLGAGRDDMGGSLASRITNAGSGIVGATLGATGGSQNLFMVRANIPNFAVIPTCNGGTAALFLKSGSAATPVAAGSLDVFTIDKFAGADAISINGGVAQQAMIIMPPTLIQNEVLVAE